MKNKKNLLLIALLILLVFLVTGCSGLFTEPPKSIISGRVLIPPDARALSKDISGWVPAAGAEVTIVDASGVTHTVVTDANGYFSFENIAVKANTIITAQVEVNGKTIILKAIIDRAVAEDQSYDVGTLTPETTALALMVERLVKDGKEIDLEKIKKAKSFDKLVDEINDVLEEHGNVADDKDVKDLIDKIMEELFPKIVPTPPAPPAIIDVAFEKLEANGESKHWTTSLLTITFDKKVTGLSAADFEVEGASIIALHSVGPTYTLYITDITVKDGETVNVKVAKSGYKFTPASQDVQVWVQDIGIGVGGSSGGTSSTIHVPSYAKSDDLMVLIFTIEGGVAPTKPDGWEELISGSNGDHITQAIYYRKLTDSLSDFSISHSDAGTSWILLRIPGGDTPLKFSNIATGQSTSPDPPELTHDFGAGTKVLWIATASLDYNKFSLITWPANLNEYRQGIGGTLFAAGETTTSNSLNPEAFLYIPDLSTPDPYWCSFTLAVKRQ